MRTPPLTAAAISLACGLSPLPSVFAQTARAEPAPALDEGEVIVLSPFEVSTQRDVGYLAGNTLAGSRLNTSLKDTGAAISVLTPEFLKDIGATNMQDVILFSNNAVPDVGDAALSINGNPMIGNGEWQLRIRGLPASYARNFFKWDASTDFYNVDRIDQTRGPNSILFGFGAPGGLVNTSTKQAMMNANKYSLSYTAGSWDRHRGTLDANIPLVPGQLAMRVNAVAENGKSWREFEFDKSRRAHIATKWQPTKDSSLRVEGEIGKVKDNVARPWLAIDQSFRWREAGRPTFSGAWPWADTIDTFWPDHRVVGDDGVVRNWLGRAQGSNNIDGAFLTDRYRDIGATDDWARPTWSAWADTPANNSLIPRHANTGGPDAVRETDYKTVSAFFESKVSDALFYELAFNHQTMDFLGYDPDGSRATTYFGNSSEIWGEASADLPDQWGNAAGANPDAGRLYVENNWTRRTHEIDSTEFRGTVAYNFATGDWARHRAAGLLSYNVRTFNRVEETEAFSDLTQWAFDPTKAEADVNRLYRRHYFTGGDASDIHVQSWRKIVPGTRWVPTQPLEETESRLSTGMVAVQSFFLKDRLVTILGLRGDRMEHDYNDGRRSADALWSLHPNDNKTKDFNATTLSGGAVYHTTKWLSLYGNVASSRDLPEVRIRLINNDIPPMPESQGGDVGIKLDLLEGKLYATVGYYKAETKHMTDWGTIQTDVSDRNTKILTALRNPDPAVSATPLITAAEYNARLVNANGFMFDRDSSGWELSLVANPTSNWRVSANFSINDVIARNSMAEVKAWAVANEAFWRSKIPTSGAYAGNAFPTGALGDASWDNLGNQVRWMNQYAIDNVITLDGHNARGQRKYGANLYTKYTFDTGPLKNLSIGGGGRYQSKNVLGMYDNTLDMTYNPTVHYGRSLTLLDASIGYNFKTEFIGKGSWVDLQVNVANVLDEKDSQIYSLTWWAEVAGNQVTRRPERIGLQEPRKVTFTATLHF
jgi:iron complex outermembrane receptor protein